VTKLDGYIADVVEAVGVSENNSPISLVDGTFSDTRVKRLEKVCALFADLIAVLARTVTMLR